MRRLHLLRHATADSSSGGLGDRYRPLTPWGREQAEGVGRHLRAAGGVDLVVSSSAARTMQTVSSMALGAPVESVDGLYNAGGSTILRLIGETDDSVASLLVVGHAPGIPTAAWELASSDSDPTAKAELDRGYPPATLATFEVEGSWAALRTARLVSVRLG